MSTFLNYIMEAGISLGVFTLIYWFILRGETRFKVSRLYLLFALVFSTVLPLFTIHMNLGGFLSASEQNLPSPDKTNYLAAVTVYTSGIPAKVSKAILSFNYSAFIYQFGAFSAIFVIALGIFQLFRMVTKNRVFRLRGSRLVVASNNISPYSFFHFIFIDKSLTEQKNWKTIVQHELEHVKQGHSFDVLFVDAMMIFQWFNPFYWIIRRLVRENHEFLADKAVISKGQISGANYKALLLSQAIGGHPVMTSNFLNVKMIQKRFKMITKKNNKKYSILKYAAGVMIALALTLTFACEDETISDQSTNDVIYLGEIMSKEDFSKMNIKVATMDADQLDVLTIYPELKGKLTLENYKLAFNMDDEAQMKLMGKLKIETIRGRLVDGPIRPAEPQKLANGEEVFIMVEDMPEYLGGEAALRKYIQDNVEYPTIASENGIQGKVYVTFVVNKEGQVCNAKIARKVDPSLDQEALRVVNSMPLWKPGKHRGQAVNVSYTVPINFALQ